MYAWILLLLKKLECAFTKLKKRKPKSAISRLGQAAGTTEKELFMKLQFFESIVSSQNQKWKWDWKTAIKKIDDTVRESCNMDEFRSNFRPKFVPFYSEA